MDTNRSIVAHDTFAEFRAAHPPSRRSLVLLIASGSVKAFEITLWCNDQMNHASTSAQRTFHVVIQFPFVIKEAKPSSR